MNPMTKWIGGATAITLCVVGGTSLATGMLGEEPRIEAEPVIDSVPGTETAAAAPAQGEAPPTPEMVSRPVVQELPKDPPSAAAAPAAAPAAKPDKGAFVIKRILPIDGPIKYGEWHWDEEGVPPGPIVMTVDLEARVISVFRNGYEIGAAAVLLGTQEHPTPLGTFPILQKKRHNISSIYGAPMPYTLRLTWDGISIHGSEVENGYASHGCIGTPEPFAAKLFKVASKGDKVIITRGKRIGMGDKIL